MSALSKLDFGMLDHQVDSCLQEHATHRVQMLEKMKPFLLEIQERLSAQGRRTDLKDTPELTFTQYLQSKEDVFQYSVRSIKLFLSEGTTTRPSQPRALKAQSTKPETPATEPTEAQALTFKEYSENRVKANGRGGLFADEDREIAARERHLESLFNTHFVQVKHFGGECDYYRVQLFYGSPEEIEQAAYVLNSIPRLKEEKTFRYIPSLDNIMKAATSGYGRLVDRAGAA